MTTLLFAGGGSGGHISPALAVAEALADEAPSIEHLFACSTRPIDAQMLAERRTLPLPAEPPSIRHPIRFARSFSRSRRLVASTIEPKNVAGVLALGGYVSVPVAAAARRAGLPVVLLNLDAVPGRANRTVARHATQVLSAVDTPDHAAFASEIVGMPIRRVAIRPDTPERCRERLGLEPDRPTLGVTGASQGARTINRVMMHLAATQRELFDGWQVIHLAGRGDADEVADGYRTAGVSAVVHDFVDEIGAFWGACDVAVSRAGANSVAEARVNMVPTVFLPYPYHADEHQRRNAMPLANTGRAVVVTDRIETEATAPELLDALHTLMRDSGARLAMRARLEAAPPPDAAAAVAQLVQNALGC